MTYYNCNNCMTNCQGDIKTFKGMIINIGCKGYSPPKGTFKLAEFALAYPQGLHDVFSQLPFEVDLSFTL